MVLLVCTGAIITVGTYSFFNAKRSLMSRTFEQLTSVRTIKQKQVEQFFSDRLRENAMFASSQSIQQLVDSVLANFSNKNAFLQNQPGATFNYQFHLQDYLDEGAYCEKLMLVFPDRSIFRLYPASHKVNFSYDEKLLDSLFTEASNLEAGVIRDHIWDEYTRRVLIASPVCLNGITKAMVFMVVMPEAINMLLFDESGLQGLGKTGETFLVGNDLAMITPSRFDIRSLPGTRVDTEATRDAFAGKHGTRLITDYRGVEVLSSYSKLNVPGLNWVICAEIDRYEATIPVYRIRNNIFLVSVGTGFVVFVIITLISRMLTRPIVNLIHATDEIGAGVFSTRVMPESTDETGKLTLAFNRMARQLQQHAEALKKEKSQRIRSMLDGQDLERQRLSRELHDGLGQSLIALKLQLESFDLSANPEAEKKAAKLRQSFNRIIDDVRRISNNLMPAALYEFGLENALRNHCESLSSQTKITIGFSSIGNHVELNRKTKIYLYRIAQEALNNVIKHARASNVKVSLIKEARSVQLVIEDNGRGINQEESCRGKGNGLFNIRERVNLLQGVMEIKTATGKGTTIHIHLPLN